MRKKEEPVSPRKSPVLTDTMIPLDQIPHSDIDDPEEVVELAEQSAAKLIPHSSPPRPLPCLRTCPLI